MVRAMPNAPKINVPANPLKLSHQPGTGSAKEWVTMDGRQITSGRSENFSATNDSAIALLIV